jgi:phospholipase C
VYRVYTHRTTFDAFNDAGVTWAVYAGDAPQTASYAELNDAFRDRFNLFGEFEEDVHDGTLPRYSFIEPRHFLRVNSQHPTHSVSLGDQLIRRVYTTLVSNPEVWKSVLLIITWDEHGGFFDRETPPEAVPPVAGVEGDFGFKFDTLGVRVPAVVVSPFIPAGTVWDQVHDHSSIVRTALDALGVGEHLTERDARAASVLPLLTLDEPRSPPALPAPPRGISRAVAAQGSPEPVELDDLQRGLVELGGLLDAQRAPRRRRAAPPPPPPLETVASPDEIELFVHHFQQEHIGNRAARLRLDAAVV